MKEGTTAQVGHPSSAPESLISLTHMQDVTYIPVKSHLLDFSSTIQGGTTFESQFYHPTDLLPLKAHQQNLSACFIYLHPTSG